MISHRFHQKSLTSHDDSYMYEFDQAVHKELHLFHEMFLAVIISNQGGNTRYCQNM